MPTNEENESILELFDISKNAQVGKVPLALIKFIPRIGESIPSRPSGKVATLHSCQC
jgi:hypothetical protein